jgi:SAM-dependent methyltransferase
VPDAAFSDPRLAALYDPLDPDRSDLEVYAEIVAELGARSVLDIGAGTGTFACLLAQRGIQVVAVEPAAASLVVARSKPGAHLVRWVHGDVGAVPTVHVDLVTMTANVAQVFVSDEEWETTLRRSNAALVEGGHLVFETRDPAAEAWLSWNREESYTQADVPGIGTVTAWYDLIDVHDDVVSFRGTFVFESDDIVLTSDSTLRFRSREQVTASLEAAGFVVAEIRDAPDRPGRELVFVARRSRAQD